MPLLKDRILEVMKDEAPNLYRELKKSGKLEEYLVERDNRATDHELDLMKGSDLHPSQIRELVMEEALSFQTDIYLSRSEGRPETVENKSELEVNANIEYRNYVPDLKIDIEEELAPNQFFKFLTMLIYPVILIGNLGSAVAVIWLLYLGSWQLLVLALTTTILLSWVIPISLTVGSGLLLAGLKNIYTNRSKWQIVISGLYVNFISISFSILVLWLFIFLGEKTETLIPSLLLSYVVALTPFMRLTKKETEISEGKISMFNTFFIQISFITSAVCYWFGMQFWYVALVFAILYLVLSTSYYSATINLKS